VYMYTQVYFYKPRMLSEIRKDVKGPETPVCALVPSHMRAHAEVHLIKNWPFVWHMGTKTYT
jgi:hypothetical protein